LLTRRSYRSIRETGYRYPPRPRYKSRVFVPANDRQVHGAMMVDGYLLLLHDLDTPAPGVAEDRATPWGGVQPDATGHVLTAGREIDGRRVR
jgi:hypothetical protein